MTTNDQEYAERYGDIHEHRNDPCIARSDLRDALTMLTEHQRPQDFTEAGRDLINRLYNALHPTTEEAS